MLRLNKIGLVLLATTTVCSLSFSPAVPPVTSVCSRNTFYSNGGALHSSMVSVMCNSKRPRRRSYASDLRMVAGAVAPVTAVKVSVATLTGALGGGVFAGGLHAIAGPDHLAALLPRCCGQRWYKAGRIGALWGLGHGVSASILGIAAFGLKNRLKGVTPGWLMHGSSLMEVAVGASLVVIGLMGIKEAREWGAEHGNGVAPQSLSSAAVEDTGVKMSKNRSVVFNGLLHGFSWDGAPSLAPAVAVATWRGNIAFLLAYGLGTTAAMAMTTTMIGEGTRKAGEILHRPDIPQKLSFVSSFIAIAVGFIWMALGLK